MYSAFGRMQKTCRVLNVLLWIAVILMSLGTLCMLILLGVMNSSDPEIRSVVAQSMAYLSQSGMKMSMTQDMINTLTWTVMELVLSSAAMIFILFKLLLVMRAVLRSVSPFDYQQVSRFRHMAICSAVAFVVLTIMGTMTSSMIMGEFSFQFADAWISTALILFSFSALFTYGAEKQMERENDAARLR